MILGTILLALAEIFSTQQGVAIIPEMRVAPGDVVPILWRYGLWLSGSVDEDNKGWVKSSNTVAWGMILCLLRPLARPWWIQRRRIQDWKRLPVPVWRWCLGVWLLLETKRKGIEQTLISRLQYSRGRWPGNRIAEIRKSTCLLYFVI